MSQAVVVVSLSNGHVILKENKEKDNISTIESQKEDNKAKYILLFNYYRLSQSKTKKQEDISSENQIQV